MPNCQELSAAELAEDASASLGLPTHKHMITTPIWPAGERAIEYHFAVQAHPSLTMQSSLTAAEAQPSLHNFKRPSRTLPELYLPSHMRQSG
jgi:hypothetical protein